MSADPMLTPSPLAALSRPTRQRRTSPYQPSRSRRNSPLSIPVWSSPDGRMSTMDSMDDSDDEGGKGPQLSQLAQKLLEDFPEANEAGLKDRPGHSSIPYGTSSAVPKRSSWDQSLGSEEHSAAPASLATVGRCNSRDTSPEYATARELATPAPGRQGRRVLNGNYSAVGSSSSGSSGNSAGSSREEPRNIVPTYGSIVRPGPGGVHGSTTASAIRWKRSGRGLLGGLAGPPRRGPRRDSDQTVDDGREEQDGYERSSPAEEEKQDDNAGSLNASPSATSKCSSLDQVAAGQPPVSTIPRCSRRSSPESLSGQIRRVALYNTGSPNENGSPGRSSPGAEDYNKRSNSPSMSRPAAAARPIAQPDKENMPPPPTPAFRRPAVAVSTCRRMTQPEEKKHGNSVLHSPDKNQEHGLLVVPPIKEVEEKKPALATKSANTPLRPAPPPPRMSMLEAATASAGASVTTTSQSTRKGRSVVHVNGKSYQRLDVIGKGGSGRVYKVMAENKKMFALKKVTFHEQDGPAAIAGYKGEIDLLKKLAGVERVIRLFDYEINDEKQNLTMLMECGESDLAKILTLRHANEDSQLDVSFVRYYWREMLLCVDAVHSLNIIHSDLKPANFLLVQGRLKLIDFGIANAIQDDTVNVYRESQVGTLNYMSPEAIVDINATSGKPMASIGQARLMKLGAPSDVWSLGCILYQMTYGKTPFSHLTSIYQKISAIPDPNYAIEYSSTGIGRVPVPRSLVTLIRSCLARDKNDRPTIRRMLSNEDVFLNPDRVREGTVEISFDNLRVLLENAVNTVETQGVPVPETIAAWAKDVYAKLERRMESNGRGLAR